MRILLIGKTGQLGQSLEEEINKLLDVNLYAPNRGTLDIIDEQSVKSYFLSNEVDLVINAAAYTNVDEAEDNQKRAFELNQIAVSYLSRECGHLKIPFIHISTDYVFDGSSKEPYLSTDVVNPISIYGKSKLGGEEAIKKECSRYLIIRTSWLFGEYGSNFFKTMASLAKNRTEISVVSDQVGCPTYTGDLAKAICSTFKTLLSKNYEGRIMHFSGRDIVSWYEFSKLIINTLFHKGMINSKPKIKAVSSGEYPSKVRRPKFSVLDSTSFKEMFHTEPRGLEEILQIICIKE